VALEVWVGFVELRQLPGENHKITLNGKGAFTWIACWATDAKSYRAKVEEVEAEYGLFVLDIENAMSVAEAERQGLMDEELADICERTSQDENYCIYGTFYGYSQGN